MKPGVRFSVFKRDNFTCQYCGRKPPNVVLEADHVLAVANGGSDAIHNLVTSCQDCNRGKGANQLCDRLAPLTETMAIERERAGAR